MCSCPLPCPLPSQQHQKTSLTCALSILNKGAGLPRPCTLKRGSSWMPPVFRGCGGKWKSTVSILGELCHVLPEYHPPGPGRPYLCHLCAGHRHLPGSPWVRSWGHCQVCGSCVLPSSPHLQVWPHLREIDWGHPVWSLQQEETPWLPCKLLEV